MENDWNPIFYVVFVPIFLGALYLILCSIGGLCSKSQRQAAAAHRQMQRDAEQAEVEQQSRRRRSYTGPDFRRGARSQIRAH